MEITETIDSPPLGSITLVTAPDIVDNDNISFCLINFKKENQDKFADLLNDYMPADDLTVYVANSTEDPHFTIEWLTNAIEKSKTVILQSKNNFKVFKNKTTINLEELFDEHI